MSDTQELLTPADCLDPYAAFARLRRDAPVYRSDSWNGWILTRYADVAAGFRDPRLSADRTKAFGARLPPPVRTQLEPLIRNLAGWALFTDPPAHTRLRGLIHRAFTPRLVEQLRPQIQGLIDEMLTAAGAHATVDFVPALAIPLPVLVIGIMLGLPPEHRRRLKTWSNALLPFLGGAAPAPAEAEGALRCILEMETYLRGLIEERRRRPGPDLISSLLAAEEEGAILNEQEILSTCSLVLFAGHETTTNLLGNVVRLLLTHTDVRARVQADPDLAPEFVEEVLRYESPVARMSRVAAVEFALHGQIIPAGHKVLLSIAAANRDERQFSDPDLFQVPRADNRHLGFGIGIHFCSGAALARLEAQLTLAALLRRFPRFSAAGEPARVDNATVRGFEHLPIHLG
jgi:cytochrome P450